MKQSSRIKLSGELAKMRANILKEGQEMMPFIYRVANSALEILFEVNEMNTAEKVLDQIRQYVPKEIKAPMADMVKFNYLSGRVYIYFHKFDLAEECLSFAFNHCIQSKPKNKRYND
jgi:hypothetical protein